MITKRRIILAAGAGAVLIVSAVLWVTVLQPGHQTESRETQELLATGISLFNGEEYNQALETLKRVPSNSPQAARARYYEGSAYLMLRDFESAIAVLEQAQALNNQDIGSLYGLGVAYFKLGNLKMAKAYFALVLEVQVDDRNSGELKEQAQGLVDIMAKLERQQQEAMAPESNSRSADAENKAN